MPRTLHDFIGIHPGETIWLFGKGPSLDRFDVGTAGPLRCAINDVVKEIPGCRYCFANDSVAAWQQVYQPGHVLFTPERTVRDDFISFARPGLAAELVSYPDDYDDARLYWPAERVAREGLTVRPGTLGSAVQIIALMGIKKIICVGIDGGRVHARRQWFTELRNDHARDYGHIKNQFKDAARRLGLVVEFHGHGPETNPDDTMTVLFLNSTQVGGDVYPRGAIADIPAEEASILFGYGHARLLTKEELAALEAQRAADTAPAAEAASAAPESETADAAPATGKRRRA